MNTEANDLAAITSAARAGNVQQFQQAFNAGLQNEAPNLALADSLLQQVLSRRRASSSFHIQRRDP